MLSGHEAFCLYLALKRHFTSDYDFHKYNGKVTASLASFKKRPDVWKFDKLAKHRDLQNFLVSAFVTFGDAWIGEIVSNPKFEKAFQETSRRRDAITYLIPTELRDTGLTIDELVKYPAAFRLYVAKKLSPEAIVALDSASGVFQQWAVAGKGDPLWDSDGRRLMKYRPFVLVDPREIRRRLFDIFSK